MKLTDLGGVIMKEPDVPQVPHGASMKLKQTDTEFYIQIRNAPQEYIDTVMAYPGVVESSQAEFELL